MFEKIKRIKSTINVVTKEQKEAFIEYLPGKVYKTERNIGIFVALTQILMIALFFLRGRSMFYDFRSFFYMTLYIFLLISTTSMLVVHHYLVCKKKYKAFFLIRRGYAAAILLWVIGMTYLEQMKGNGLGIYSYLLPTLAAVVFMTPIESFFVFGSSWLGIVIMFMHVHVEGSSIFGYMINGTFVTLLALFISHRYYRSLTIEYCDRQIIEQSNQLLQSMVHTDQLTGLYNRHFLRDQLYTQYQKHTQNHWNGMFLMVDIDYFKQYNDCYGHLQGDVCLKGIAAIITRICVEDDVKAIRYGGEEFLLIKMSEQPFDGMKFANKLLKAIEEENLPRTDTKIERVTVSAGVWYGRLEETEHIETAIKWADQALYEAKNKGRNRIENQRII